MPGTQNQFLDEINNHVRVHHVRVHQFLDEINNHTRVVKEKESLRLRQSNGPPKFRRSISVGSIDQTGANQRLTLKPIHSVRTTRPQPKSHSCDRFASSMGSRSRSTSYRVNTARNVINTLDRERRHRQSKWDLVESPIGNKFRFYRW